MAYELYGFVCPGAVSLGDLSSNQFKCVKKNATNDQFILCTTDGEVFDGVQMNKPAATGRELQVVMQGVVRVEAGETLTAGDHWGTDANGLAKIVAATNTGADVGDFAMGRVLTGCSSGGNATVTIGMHTFKVESA